ncbi:MAG: T9SS type A sorting domain-containing protein [Flavobacteriales bacterium]|nr:T9SS type A sorting domain-containing protein [Flavobacteriales bacterium]
MKLKSRFFVSLLAFFVAGLLYLQAVDIYVKRQGWNGSNPKIHVWTNASGADVPLTNTSNWPNNLPQTTITSNGWSKYNVNGTSLGCLFVYPDKQTQDFKYYNWNTIYVLLDASGNKVSVTETSPEATTPIILTPIESATANSNGKYCDGTTLNVKFSTSGNPYNRYVRYTTDGSDPKTSSTYQLLVMGSSTGETVTGIDVTSTTTVRAVEEAQYGGAPYSEEFTKTYTFENCSNPISIVTITKNVQPNANGNYSAGTAVNVTIARTQGCGGCSYVDKYTTDGSDPKTSATAISFNASTSIQVSSDTTVRAISYPVYGDNSNYIGVSETLTFDVSEVIVTTNTEPYKDGRFLADTTVEVSLSHIEGKEMYFTLDGTVPEVIEAGVINGEKYQNPFDVRFHRRLTVSVVDGYKDGLPVLRLAHAGYISFVYEDGETYHEGFIENTANSIDNHQASQGFYLDGSTADVSIGSSSIDCETGEYYYTTDGTNPEISPTRIYYGKYIRNRTNPLPTIPITKTTVFKSTLSMNLYDIKLGGYRRVWSNTKSSIIKFKSQPSTLVEITSDKEPNLEGKYLEGDKINVKIVNTERYTCYCPAINLYTIDGSDPRTSSTAIDFGSLKTIEITSTTTVRAISYPLYGDNSQYIENSKTFIFADTPQPVSIVTITKDLQPNTNGNYSAGTAVNVTIARTQGCGGCSYVDKYTTDGSDPKTSTTAQSFTASKTIQVSSNTTVRAISYPVYGDNSNYVGVSETLTFEQVQPVPSVSFDLTPSYNEPSGDFYVGTVVTTTLSYDSTASSDWEIYYSTDENAVNPANIGTNSQNAIKYTGAFTVTSDVPAYKTIYVLRYNKVTGYSIASTPIHYPFVAPTNTGKVVYVKRQSWNGSNPKIHVWKKENGQDIAITNTSNWPNNLPSTTTTVNNGWSTYTFEAAEYGCLFKYTDKQTVDFKYYTSDKYILLDANGNLVSVTDTNPDAPQPISIVEITKDVQPNANGNYSAGTTVNVTIARTQGCGGCSYVDKYTTDGSDPKTSATAQSFTASKTIQVSANTTVRAISYPVYGDNSNYVGVSETLTFDAVSSNIKIYIKTLGVPPAQLPKIHVWDRSSGQDVAITNTSNWPNNLPVVTPSNSYGYSVYEVPSTSQNLGCLFIIGGVQTADQLNITQDTWFEFNNGVLVSRTTSAPSARKSESLSVSQEGGEFTVAPSPASEFVKINYPFYGTKSVQVAIYNVNGSLVYNENGNYADGYHKVINLNEVSTVNGLHIIKVTDGNEVLSKKILINK